MNATRSIVSMFAAIALSEAHSRPRRGFRRALCVEFRGLRSTGRQGAR
jgi:hypothetical protein